MRGCSLARGLTVMNKEGRKEVKSGADIVHRNLTCMLCVNIVCKATVTNMAKVLIFHCTP